MLAKDLQIGDWFVVSTANPESTYRICLANNAEEGLIYGLPNNPQSRLPIRGSCVVTLICEDRKEGIDGEKSKPKQPVD